MKKNVEVIVFKKNGSHILFLLLRRKESKGGFWQPVVGQVRNNEDINMAMFRELREETCIISRDIAKIHGNIHCFDISKDYLTGRKILPVREHVFAVHVIASTTVHIDHNPDNEHDSFRWVSYTDALKLLDWKDNVESVRKTYAKLKQPIYSNIKIHK